MEGCAPDIHVVEADLTKDPQQLEYIHKAVDVICTSAEHARGLKDIAVTPYVHPLTLQGIIAELYRLGFDYEYRNPLEYQSKSRPLDLNKIQFEKVSVQTSSESLPLITFVTGTHVDGSEYGAVVVLIERTLPSFWDQSIFDSLFIAITRATSRLSIVVNNANEAPWIRHKPISENNEATPLLWQRLSKYSDVNIPASSFIQVPHNQYSENLIKIIYNSQWNQFPVLILGKLPSNLNLTEIRWDDLITKYMWSSKNSERKHKHINCCDETKV